MFGISGEHLVVLGIILLIVGPKRLPELGNSMGRAMRNFKDALNGVEEAKFRRLKAEEQMATETKTLRAAPDSQAPDPGESGNTTSA